VVVIGFVSGGCGDFAMRKEVMAEGGEQRVRHGHGGLVIHGRTEAVLMKTRKVE
jgi:hypothetical protein